MAGLRRDLLNIHSIFEEMKMKPLSNLLRAATAMLAGLALLSGCGGGDSSTSSSGTGTLNLSITDQPGAEAYPIAGTTWIILYKNQADAAEGKVVTRFIQWTIHNGQKYANDLDYAQLAPGLAAKAEAALKSVMCGGSSCLGG